jgi:hypothetical protein
VAVMSFHKDCGSSSPAAPQLQNLPITLYLLGFLTNVPDRQPWVGVTKGHSEG